MDQCHICMCIGAVAWTSDVKYICVIGLRGLRLPGQDFRA